ncbi:MAG: twin-arginine translocase TatA/TatE family subunit [Planctomycetota bacterium]|nr:twin-arginine translocase TatA/TatE family subunit [Planctomycetota bacterium]
MVASFDMLAWMPGAPEMLVIAAVALLFFGRRLPDVARSMGKSIVEFKKGLKDVKDDIDTASTPDDNRKALPANDESNEDKSSTRG